jgi:predicted metal-dependent phosphoesterase TrpH
MVDLVLRHLGRREDGRMSHPSGVDLRRGRADLHIHTLASDGVSDVAAILEQAVTAGLDVIAITDHERIDAAVAARSMAEQAGLPLEVIVGEEISTRSGHLVGLFLRQRIRPWQSLRASVARVHEQGGVAIVAHPLVPYPLCASAGSIRRLLDDADAAVHPDALEAFNPTTARMRWSRRVPAFAEEVGLAAVAASDAHRASAVGRAFTTFAGTRAADVRVAIEARDTGWGGEAYTWREQVGTFGRQLERYASGARDDLRGLIRRDGSGRDLGYPGGRARPPRFDPSAAHQPGREPR